MTNAGGRDTFSGDRPWQSGATDWFGLKPFASRVATSLLAGGTNSGLVVGIEGKWGTGKSSLLNMILDELRQRPEGAQTIAIEFRPWLVGDRDALLGSLFDELARAIGSIEHAGGDATKTSILAAKDAGKKIKEFGARLSGPAKLLSLAGMAIPGLSVAGEIVGKLAEAAKEEAAGPSLAELKDDLTRSLSALETQIIVTVDDVDRLEPSEVWEMLRLIRAVADFPNVTYVLCYDHDVISSSIGEVAKLSDGSSFLEKIIQVVIPVPSPEAFQLRHWFRSELGNFAFPRTDDEHQRLLSVIDREGGRRLRTPRAVVRALNAIRLFWPALNEQGADLADTVWLQAIKTSNQAYYKWIERYCDNFSVISSGRAALTERQKKEEFNELLSMYEKDGIDFSEESYFVDEVLPGIDTWSAMSPDKISIYAKRDKDETDKAIRGRRLSSPDHYRLYFALAQPEGAPTQSDYDEVWDAADRGAAAFSRLLLQWHERGPTQGVTKATNMLDRLGTTDPKTISPARVRSILLGLADVADEAALKVGIEEFYGPEFWNASERVFQLFLPRVARSKRTSLLRDFFDGRALGWLTTLFRREYFAQGRFGTQRRSESEWRMTSAELDTVTSLMLSRYKALKPEQLLATPRVLNVLFAWQQSGDEQGPRELIQTAMGSDKDLVSTLERLAGRVLSSPGGLVITLSRDNVGSFFDFDAAQSRIQKLTRKRNDLAERAKQIEYAFKAGERF